MAAKTTESKRTPSPWMVDWSDDGPLIYTGDLLIASVSGSIDLFEVSGLDQSTTEANAALVSAAPELGPRAEGRSSPDQADRGHRPRRSHQRAPLRHQGRGRQRHQRPQPGTRQARRIRGPAALGIGRQG
jgi:hypothetical protein